MWTKTGIVRSGPSTALPPTSQLIETDGVKPGSDTFTVDLHSLRTELFLSPPETGIETSQSSLMSPMEGEMYRGFELVPLIR